jgi:hypothetical protein
MNSSHARFRYTARAAGGRGLARKLSLAPSWLCALRRCAMPGAGRLSIVSVAILAACAGAAAGEGATRTVTITTRTIDAPPPPPRPADPIPADALVRYNLARLNLYRAHAKLQPLLYDAKISAFAEEGSRELSRDHVPHAHFEAHVQKAPGFGSHSAENQGDPNGVPPQVGNGKAQIEAMLQMMMAEGPGGGHHDNIVNPRYRRVGIGIVLVGGALYLTNDFSD